MEKIKFACAKKHFVAIGVHYNIVGDMNDLVM